MLKKIGIVIALTQALSGCVNINGGGQQASFKYGSPMQAGADDAVISFFHPIGLEDVPVPVSTGLGAPLGSAGLPIFLKANNVYQIWDGNGLVGFLPVSRNCIQVRVKPGKQTFLGRFVRSNAGNWTVLEGDVAAGKSYLVKVSQRWNTWKPAVVFEAYVPAPEAADPCSTPLLYDKTSPESAGFWDNHVTANQDEVKKVFSDLQAGGKDYYRDPVLKPENGR